MAGFRLAGFLHTLLTSMPPKPRSRSHGQQDRSHLPLRPPSSASATRSRCGRPARRGPFDRWPTGTGFEYFYGFIAGETSQWYPALHEFNQPVEPPKSPEEGYHLTEDLVDKAIAWVRQQKAVTPR
jgi:arylsulfatase A-like enzyme